MLRQIVLDTETTGMRTEDGHRIIEVGCIELIDRKLTGKHFHRYINPERAVDAGALAVHGLSNDFLRDKPVFLQILPELMAFVTDAELIIHNAPFDVGFINYELKLASREWRNITDHCRIIDTLALARQLHVGQRNSLDALCKRYFVDNSKRDYHGALLDAHLLAQVYLAMTGGQGSFFDSLTDEQAGHSIEQTNSEILTVQKHQLLVLKATEAELSEHDKYLEMLKTKGKCLWLDS